MHSYQVPLVTIFTANEAYRADLVLSSIPTSRHRCIFYVDTILNEKCWHTTHLGNIMCILRIYIYVQYIKYMYTSKYIHIYSIPSIVFALLPQLLPLSQLKSTIVSHSGHSSFLPATVRAFEFHREKSSTPSSLVAPRRMGCVHRLCRRFSASPILHKIKRPTTRRVSNS